MIGSIEAESIASPARTYWTAPSPGEVHEISFEAAVRAIHRMERTDDGKSLSKPVRLGDPAPPRPSYARSGAFRRKVERLEQEEISSNEPPIRDPGSSLSDEGEVAEGLLEEEVVYVWGNRKLIIPEL